MVQPSPKILQKQAYLQESPPSFPTPILTLCVPGVVASEGASGMEMPR